jgi:hypothetical protein
MIEIKTCPICKSKLIEIKTSIPTLKPPYNGGSADVTKIVYLEKTYLKCSNPDCPYRETPEVFPRSSDRNSGSNESLGLLGSNC